MNDKIKPSPQVGAVTATAAAQDEPAGKLFAVTQAFWLGDKLCAANSKVQLTDSQAKRLGEAVKAD